MPQRPERPAPTADTLRLALRRRRALRRAVGVIHVLAWAGGSALLAGVAMVGLLSVR